MNKASPPPSFARPAFVDSVRAEFAAAKAAHPDTEFVDALVIAIVGLFCGLWLLVGEAKRLYEPGKQLQRSVYLMSFFFF